MLLRNGSFVAKGVVRAKHQQSLKFEGRMSQCGNLALRRMEAMLVEKHIKATCKTAAPDQSAFQPIGFFFRD
jgi:hypothetical protein